jgi:hypothetical protein
MKAHMLTVCAWPAYQPRETMEQQFRQLPYQAYAPVRGQLYRVAKAVNRTRRRTGLAPVNYGCIPDKMRVTRVFIDPGACGS